MRTPFARPILSVVFYALAVVVFLVYLLLALGLTGGGVGGGKGIGGLFALTGLYMLAVGAIAAAFLTAVGYVIELLVKIEWNTCPKTDDMGYIIEPSPAPATGAVMADKQYYVSDKGRLTGPLNAHEILALYRDGRISIAAQISVEENGQRRLLKNLSELGL